MNILDQITADYKKNDIPDFKVGDTVRVHIKIKEGNRERIQVFEGFVLKRQSGGISETFTVRKISSGVGVEKTFPVHSPKIEKIEIVREGDVRRAKLNYMRDRTGKSARIKSKSLEMAMEEELLEEAAEEIAPEAENADEVDAAEEIEEIEAEETVEETAEAAEETTEE